MSGFLARLLQEAEDGDGLSPPKRRVSKYSSYFSLSRWRMSGFLVRLLQEPEDGDGLSPPKRRLSKSSSYFTMENVRILGKTITGP